VPDAEIHLFDPVRSERLMGKIAGKSNIRYNEYGLGSYPSIGPFHPAYGSILKREDDPKLTDHTEVSIKIDTVENYCNKNGIESIDLLKIDTEGWDFEVIRGCGAMLDKIKYIQFEDWNVDPSDHHSRVDEVVKLLWGRHFMALNSKPINFIAKL
jgi:FkbM family methyltransferase